MIINIYIHTYGYLDLRYKIDPQLTYLVAIRCICTHSNPWLMADMNFSNESQVIIGVIMGISLGKTWDRSNQLHIWLVVYLPL